MAQRGHEMTCARLGTKSLLDVHSLSDVSSLEGRHRPDHLNGDHRNVLVADGGTHGSTFTDNNETDDPLQNEGSNSAPNHLSVWLLSEFIDCM